ncbi:unnamed protein product [Caenorhabditis angaria]|uniref:C-type lectin domain-containing protein n=1 Tax=Caenorhabditis angaria TaxID=860376 RepID=A0A9P1I8V0_9PELO|nr:unnamed protein product [Caenorhabditis angaria]
MILKVLVFFLCVQLVDSCQIRCRARECDAGWSYYKRNTTGWCMKVFVGTVNMTRAEAVCSGVGAVMSSIDDVDMYNFTAKLQASASSSVSWLGALLNTDCECGDYECPVTDSCGPNGYYWTDGYTTSNDFLLKYLDVAQEVKNGQDHYYFIGEGVNLYYSGIEVASSYETTDSVICGKQSNN